jgi:hypothetical protein
MSDFEKRRAQTDAQRAVARRRTGSVVAEQAILRHLGIELYRQRHQAERPPADTGVPTDDELSDDSTER